MREGEVSKKERKKERKKRGRARKTSFGVSSVM